ncbi:hypothetical protein ACFPDQ_03590 [Pseudofrancisella aestuarii]|uniref:C4-dicarboxylate ABC transporter permease n=1 Tax=Pseudofrancisella aestuarii TaxID=2670347 RepID=A0ABV9TB32_9GAMM|nr:hypothetical protein [Pseudofrancisella aestuarii]
MLKKILCIISLILFLSVTSFAQENKFLRESPINNPTYDTPPKENSIGTILMTPITIAGIAVASVVMIPVGSLTGFFGGAVMSPMIFDNGDYISDREIVRVFEIPAAAGGLAMGGAIYMTGKLPVETAKSLGESAQENGYMV